MRKSEESQSEKLLHLMSGVLMGAAVSAALCIMFLFACSVGISMGLISEDRIYQLTVAGCVFGSLLGGTAAVHKCGTAPLPIGTAVGGIHFLLMLTIGFLLFGSDIAGGGGLGLLLGCLCGGAVSGMLGSKRRPRRRKRR